MNISNEYQAKLSATWAKLAGTQPNISSLPEVLAQFWPDLGSVPCHILDPVDICQEAAVYWGMPFGRDHLDASRTWLWTAVTFPDEPESRPVLDELATKVFRRGWARLTYADVWREDTMYFEPTAGGRYDMLCIAWVNSIDKLACPFNTPNLKGTPWGTSPFKRPVWP